MTDMRRYLYNNGSWGYIGVTMDGQVKLAVWNGNLEPSEARKIAAVLNEAANMAEGGNQNDNGTKEP